MSSTVKNDICKISLLKLSTGMRIFIGLLVLGIGGLVSFILLRSPVPVAAYVLGGIFIIIAIRCMGCFHNLIVDPEKGTLTWQKGVVFATSTKSIDLKDITGVLQVKEVHRHKNGSINYYVAKLQFKDEPEEESKFRFDTSISPEKGEVLKSLNQFRTRRVAEKLAACLRLPLTDKTRGATVVRSWDELDMSIAEKWAKENEKPQKPSTPDCMLNRVNEITTGGVINPAIK